MSRLVVVAVTLLPVTDVCREQERALAQVGMPAIQPHVSADQARFTGGGFNFRQIPGSTNSTITA